MPKSSQLHQAGLSPRHIDGDEILLDMIEDRNRSPHVYNEKTAEAIFTRIQKIYAPAIQKVLQDLNEAV